MSPPKLFAVDLDGTLLRSDKTLDPDGVRALRQASDRGVIVVVITARAHPSASEYCRELGIGGPLACLNGAVLYDRHDGLELCRHTIPIDVARDLAARADEQRWPLGIRIGETSYYPDYGQSLPPDPHRVYGESNLAAVTEPPLRIHVSDPDCAADLAAYCKLEHAGRVRTVDTLSPDYTARWLLIQSPEATKGIALWQLSARLGVPASETAAIGDDLADLEMFEVAGVSVAMSNGHPDVIAAADLVAPANDEGGLAWAVERLLGLGGAD